MRQLGFFDADKRLATLSANGDPLEAFDRLMPWGTFRADIIEAVVLTVPAGLDDAQIRLSHPSSATKAAPSHADSSRLPPD